MEGGIIFILVLYIIAWLGEKISGLFQGSASDHAARHIYLKSSENIRDYGINEIRSSGYFSASERKAEYRRRGKSPSGVINGVYNDMYRGNDSYNDSYRDWDADA